MIRALYIASIALALTFGGYVYAQALDSDSDGISDYDERAIYYTDLEKKDTDGDGYPDSKEIANGFSPRHGKGTRLADVDSDKDGLDDAFELAYGTSIMNSDSDGDVFGDRLEIWNGYDPRSRGPKRVEKRIVVTLAKQELSYYVDGVRLATEIISSGKRNWPTPKGEFRIANKHPRAWSRMAGLWMPYWMALGGGKFPTGLYGIHELPEWPNGYKEGENHLGTPVSHGCIRLGTGPAQELYEWSEIGTPVSIL